MIARPTRSMVSAIIVLLAAGVTLAGIPLQLTGPAPTAQVGAYYSSGLTAVSYFGTPSFSIVSGSLPPGLTLGTPSGSNPGFAPITGTPTTAGAYTFTAGWSDISATAPERLAAAHRRGLAQSNQAFGGGNIFTITVDPASPAGAPTSPWTLAIVMAGLAGAGFLRLRQQRHA